MAGLTFENERPAAALPHDRIVPAVAAVPRPGSGSSSRSAAGAGAGSSRYSNVNLELALRALPPPRLRGHHDSEVNADDIDVPDLQTEPPEAGSPGPAAAAPSRPGPSDCPSTDTQPDQAAAAAPVPAAGTELALALVVVAQAAAPAAPSTNANCNSSGGGATTNSASNIRGGSTPNPAPLPVPVGITGDMTAEAVRRQEACVARHLRSLGEHEAREVLEVAGGYKCERCGVRFQDVAALRAHYRGGAGGAHHMCAHCRRDFPAREMFVEHAPTCCALYRWPWYPDPVAPDAAVDLRTGLTRRVNVKKRRVEGAAFLTWPWAPAAAAAGSLTKAGPPAASGSSTSASTSNISSSAGQSTGPGPE